MVSGTRSFAMLAVCTGNLARSPLSAQLLHAQLGGIGSKIAVSSAGTEAVVGEPMTEQAAGLSWKYGGDPTGHRARQLVADQIDESDLIVTATRQHRADVVSLLPRAARYTFTLKQFARLIESLDEEALREAYGRDSLLESYRTLVTVAAAQRGFLPPLADPAGDDIEDPFLQSQGTYDRVGAEVAAAVKTISAAFQRVTSMAKGEGHVS